MVMRSLALTIGILFSLVNSTSAQTGYTLQQCIDYAWKNHPQVKLLEQGQHISYEQLEQLKAAMQPSLSANASQNVNMGRSIDPFTYQFTTETIFSNNFSLNAGLTLFSGFKNLKSKEQQVLLIEANKENINKIKNDIALSIANQYLQVILLTEQIAAVDTQLIQTKKQNEREELLMTSGKSNQNKLLQLKAQVLNEENRKTELEFNLKNALASLKYACNISDPAFNILVPDIQVALNSSNQLTLDYLFTEAEQNMASMKYAKANETYFLKGIELGRSGFYPSLSLNGNISSGYSSARKQTVFEQVITNQPIGYLFSSPTELVYGPVLQNNVLQKDYSFGSQVKDNFSQYIGLSLRIPILTNRLNKTNLNVSRLNYERAKTESENTLLNLKKDIETSYNQYELSRIRNSRNEEILSIQKQILTNLTTYYNAGSISLFELLSQKNTTYQSNSVLIQSKYEMVFRKLVLDYYCGKPLSF